MDGALYIGNTENLQVGKKEGRNECSSILIALY